uniref:helix-turn-helix transcriptional regulator n=1 Tax=Bacteroides caccae TaxID=47678 RepID=UPI00359C2AAC
MENLNLEKMELYLNNFIPEYKNKAGVFLCMSGSAEVLANNQMYHIKKGILYIISPLVTLQKISQSEDFDGVYIIDEMEIFYAVIHSIIDTILHLKLRNSPCMQLEEHDIQFIIDRKKRIDEKKERLKENISEEEKTIIRQMIHLLEQEAMLEVVSIYFRTGQVKSQPIEKSEAIVYNFIYSLHMHFKTERSVTFYANDAQLSTGHFTSIVKKKTGQTPSEWIIAITISHIKLQLEKSQKNIKEIANELNFPEQFTFRKYFKQYVGVPPKQYRMQTLKESDHS